MIQGVPAASCDSSRPSALLNLLLRPHVLRTMKRVTVTARRNTSTASPNSCPFAQGPGNGGADEPNCCASVTGVAAYVATLLIFIGGNLGGSNENTMG